MGRPAEPWAVARAALAAAGIALATFAVTGCAVGHAQRVTLSQHRMFMLHRAVDTATLEDGRLPATLEGAAARAGVSEQDRVDAWGRPFAYEALAGGAGYRLLSLGEDGRPGGDGAEADFGSGEDD
ncbi:MAG: type II secretion system protein GspG [Planctomycetes bacterium]|nr:type II secretion system protein GspG [Planctomycetota bacterium]